MIFSFDLDSQPNGGIAENCLTTFIPNGRDSPKWFDRPCIEKSDSVGDPGHKFMCECDFQDQKLNPLGDTFAQPCLQLCKYYPSKYRIVPSSNTHYYLGNQLFLSKGHST